MSGSVVLVHLAGAVALMLFATRMVRTGVERAYGDVLRHRLRATMRNPFMAVLAGTGLAIAFQSSTAVTLLVGSFAGAGIVSGLSGQLAVAEVILNRMKSGRFPKSICSVVTQPGQFSFVRGGRVPVIANNAAYRTAVAVARVAIDDAWDSPAANAMYFHARRVSPGWRMTKIAAIGNHVFYR